jgi:hypothetical protein
VRYGGADERAPGARNDAMPTTRGLNFFAADPNLEFVGSTLLGPADEWLPALVDWTLVPADALAEHPGGR